MTHSQRVAAEIAGAALAKSKPRWAMSRRLLESEMNLCAASAPVGWTLRLLAKQQGQLPARSRQPRPAASGYPVGNNGSMSGGPYEQ